MVAEARGSFEKFRCFIYGPVFKKLVNKIDASKIQIGLLEEKLTWSTWKFKFNIFCVVFREEATYLLSTLSLPTECTKEQNDIEK